MSNHIKEILFALTDAEVEFVVGVTLDFDLALDMEPANVEKRPLLFDSGALSPIMRLAQQRCRCTYLA